MKLSDKDELECEMATERQFYMMRKNSNNVKLECDLFNSIKVIGFDDKNITFTTLDDQEELTINNNDLVSYAVFYGKYINRMRHQ